MDILPQTTLAKVSTDIRVTRLLPQRGEVNVQNGQEVTPTQIIARSYQSAQIHILEAHRLYGIEPAELDKLLLVDVGTPLEKGTPLIRNPGRSAKPKVFSSPVAGMLVEVFDGSLIIQKPQKLFELRAMVHGKVSRIIPGMGIELQLIGSIVQAIWDSGRESHGRLVMSTVSNKNELTLDKIQAEMGRSIVVAGKISSNKLLEVLENYQARGLIVGSIPAALIPKAREVMFPIFVTDGFGEQSMSAPLFEIFQQSSGKEASLVRGQGENGYQRPEIIIPSPDPQYVKSGNAGWDLLKNGDYIRVVMSRNNLIGKVITIHPEARRTISGGWMPGADIELDSGEVVFVPYTNIDVIN